jgi:hypothetical protein
MLRPLKVHWNKLTTDEQERGLTKLLMYRKGNKHSMGRLQESNHPLAQHNSDVPFPFLTGAEEWGMQMIFRRVANYF